MALSVYFVSLSHLYLYLPIIRLNTMGLFHVKIRLIFRDSQAYLRMTLSPCQVILYIILFQP